MADFFCPDHAPECFLRLDCFCWGRISEDIDDCFISEMFHRLLLRRWRPGNQSRCRAETGNTGETLWIGNLTEKLTRYFSGVMQSACLSWLRCISREGRCLFCCRIFRSSTGGMWLSIYISMNEKEWRKVAAPAAPQRQSHNSRDCPDIFLLPRRSRNSLPERKGLPAR